MRILKKTYLLIFAATVLFSCKTPKPQEHRYVDYQPYFNQSQKEYVRTPSLENTNLDTLVQVLSNLRDEVYNFVDTLIIVEEFEFSKGELIIDIDLINEKPPIFDTFMVVKGFRLKDELVNSLFPIVPDSITIDSTAIGFKSDSLQPIVIPPVVEKKVIPKKNVKPVKKKKVKPRKYVIPAYVRTVNGKQKYVPQRSVYRKVPPKATPKPVEKQQPVVVAPLAPVLPIPVVKKEIVYFTREQILADTLRDLLDADTIISSVFLSTGWEIGDSIPLYSGFSEYMQDSSVLLETEKVFVEIHDTSRLVKQYPLARLTRELTEKKMVSNTLIQTNRVVFRHFYKDEEDVFMKMVRVSGGAFKMGNKEFDEDERPEYGLRVSDFLLGQFEVTNEVLCSFLNMLHCDSLGYVNRTPVVDVKSRYSKFYWDVHTGRYKVYHSFEKYPAINITWAGANLICKQMGGRLPSEAEWEYAAKGGAYAIRYYTNADKTDYTYEHRFAGGNIMSEAGWFVDNSDGYCQMVGGFAPNRLKLFDMSGNVWEWCYDNYDKDFYKRNNDSSDPMCIISNGVRVNRGGSWSSDAMFCRITNRNFFDEFQCNPYLGFRLMRQWQK